MSALRDNGAEAVRERLEFLSQLGLGYHFISPDGRLNGLETRVRACRACPLARTRNLAVPGEGNPNADLMFVGEGPGHDEDIAGRPFVGKAGQLLTRIISAMGFDRQQVYITNIVKCRPPGNRNPEEGEILACRGYLFEQLDIIRPRVIVSLGNVPTQFFSGRSQGITTVRGRFFEFGGCRVMPTYHPSYIVRRDYSKKLKGEVWKDMQKVMAYLQEP